MWENTFVWIWAYSAKEAWLHLLSAQRHPNRTPKQNTWLDWLKRGKGGYVQGRSRQRLKNPHWLLKVLWQWEDEHSYSIGKHFPQATVRYLVSSITTCRSSSHWKCKFMVSMVTLLQKTVRPIHLTYDPPPYHFTFYAASKCTVFIPVHIWQDTVKHKTEVCVCHTNSAFP